jgi:hypothetical protein
MTNKKITDKQRIQILEQVIQDTFWMARRYAHGRKTYAPSMVRDAYNLLKNLGIEIKHDDVIKAPENIEFDWRRFDYLDDINE